MAAVIGGANNGIEVRVGDPALQLAACAELVDADLVVVGGTAGFHAALADDVAAPVLAFARTSLSSGVVQLVPTTTSRGC